MMKDHLAGKKKEKQVAQRRKEKVQEELWDAEEGGSDTEADSDEDEDERNLRRGMLESQQQFDEHEQHRRTGAGSSRAPEHRPIRPLERSTSVHFQECGPRLGRSQSSARPEGKQSKLKAALKGIKNVKKTVGRVMADFFIYNHIPFHVASSAPYKHMVETIQSASTGVKPPTPWKISNPYLDEARDDMHNYISTFHPYWDEYGCTIMCDGWTTQNRRNIVNFLVYCPIGTIFLKSIDATEQYKNGNYIFTLMDSIIQEIGEKRVVQVVTDNGPNYKAGGKLLMEKYNSIFWTPCAAHCIDLMFKDIAKDQVVKDIVDKCKDLSSFIYNHQAVLNLMRQHTQNRELIRPAITRFATQFIALDSIFARSDDLKRMFLSTEWTVVYNRLSVQDKITGSMAQALVLGGNFWIDIAAALGIFSPLVKVLRMVDSDDRAEMGFLYEAMDRAKEAIKKNVGKGYKKW